MKKLTALATIFLPITWLTGFYGMNFAFMEEHLTSPGAFVAASVSMLGVVVCLIVFFRRRGWM